MAPKVATKSSDPSILETLTIYSNVNPSDTVNLADGILELNYIESIMNDTIKVNLSFVDTGCLLYTSPSPRDISGSRMPSSA